MKSSIVPLSAVPADLVCDYLVRQGMAAETARWKYYDEAFNRGRNRGFAWFSKERVRGFIGVIPVKRATPVGDRDMVWTCDWAVEEWGKNPGIGVRLLGKVHTNHGYTGGVGGTDHTNSILPRMTTRTVAGASVSLRLPLRLGPLLEAAERKLAFLPKLSRTGLRNLPMPSKIRVRNTDTAQSAQGGSPALAPLFDQPAGDDCRVRYDHGHLDWIARRPGGRAISCWIGDVGVARAGALMLSHRSEPDHWRVIFRSAPEADDMLDAAIANVVTRLAGERASLVSTIVSSRDHVILNRLKAAGFMERAQRLPLYIPESQEPGACQDGFAQMSYLDTDLAFES